MVTAQAPSFRATEGSRGISFSEKLMRDWGEKYDFESTGAHLDLPGYCAECRQKVSG